MALQRMDFMPTICAVTVGGDGHQCVMSSIRSVTNLLHINAEGYSPTAQYTNHTLELQHTTNTGAVRRDVT